ncbi:Uncharacterized protein FWK35_00021770 [Aphis craccivora]|uniref:MULE domain-containing protein n=1 Tax=Aphis craccivora TaxID=307492 RepID=A0A6G0Y795_APHCR|nr:Uncharacterized protein FWK35_00021770 [Aphis craccivora]
MYNLEIQRNKELAVVNGYKHRFVGVRKCDQLLKWRCSSDKNCTAFIFSNLEKKIVLDSKGIHNHPADTPNKIEKQVLRENCKRRAEESLLQTPESSAIRHRDIKSVSKAMYDQRRKHFPVLPTSLDNALQQLRILETDKYFMFKKQQFIYAPADANFICLTTVQNINFLVQFCSELFCDGTFDYSPNAHKAVLSVFPNVKIMACRFHLGQSWWRKIQSESSLREAYINSNDELGKWLKQFFALPFLECHEVNKAFTELISICPSDVGYLFSDYILNNYIGDECLFPPEMWTEKPSMNPRTTNGSESFHRTYNGQFYHPHPHIYLVIKVLMEFQSETEIKIRSITSNNDQKMLNAKEKERMEFTINTYDKYKSNQIDIIQFLSQVGPRYQGKKLI